MKIFFVDPMGYGNLALYDASLLNAISELDIDYFTNTKFELEELNHSIYRIYNYSDKKGFFKIASYINSQLYLFKHINKKSPSLIHFQWFKVPYLDFFILKLLKRRGIKILHTAHNLLPHDSGSQYSKIYKKIYKLVDAIIVHTDATKEEITVQFNIAPEKVNVVPHGILKMPRGNIAEVNETRQNLENLYGLKNKKIFSILGSINKYKGVELTIKAWELLNLPPDAQIHLIIAGNGNLDMLKVLKDNSNATVINRFLSNDEFIALIHISDFVMLPYLQISQSGILLTALNEKKRIIVSKKGGLTEPFKFGNIGCILDDVTESNLAETIRIANTEFENFPNEKIWNDIHSYYDWDTIGNKTKKIYLDLIN
jgi:D-inositol-3-phosphate glycosyltransferase